MPPRPRTSSCTRRAVPQAGEVTPGLRPPTPVGVDQALCSVIRPSRPAYRLEPTAVADHVEQPEIPDQLCRWFTAGPPRLEIERRPLPATCAAVDRYLSGRASMMARCCPVRRVRGERPPLPFLLSKAYRHRAGAEQVRMDRQRPGVVVSNAQQHDHFAGPLAYLMPASMISRSVTTRHLPSFRS